MMELTADPLPTKRQIASRANGAKSKGPVTEEGKKKSSLNALKHGLCGSIDNLLKGENRESQGALTVALYQEYSPQTSQEIILVEDIITLIWRLRRTYRIERDLFEEYENGAHQHFAEGHGGALLIERYSTSIRNSLDKITRLLQSRITGRKKSNPFQTEEDVWKQILSAPEPEHEPEPEPQPVVEEEPAEEESPSKPSPRQIRREKLLKAVAHMAKNPTPEIKPRRTTRKPKAA